jgi:hypothetical protein
MLIAGNCCNDTAPNMPNALLTKLIKIQIFKVCQKVKWYLLTFALHFG